MDRDLLFLLGLAFVPLALVALVSAWADRRAPWAALIVGVMAAGLIGWAYLTHPEGGYIWREVPDLAVETLGRYWTR
ncbi:hypothetical protein [Pararhodobacter oceanensis]|uniref:hypothetical protein n=1 Tax=Pararhodobacter oceanensis TaxID=2172121 RepID=UPI003A91EE30